MQFSKDYRTFEDWLKAHPEQTAYNLRIIRSHSKYPNASLSQLRGHTSNGKKPVSRLKPEPIYKRSWNSLNKRQLSQREKSLDVLTRVKNGKSLTHASKELKTTPKTVIKHTNAFKKINNKWVAKTYDKISRIMSINEHGKQEWIDIKDSRIASKIGKYNSAVKEFLISGNQNAVNRFTEPIKDSYGKLHYLETDPEKLIEIEESQEEPEFYEIYKTE